MRLFMIRNNSFTFSIIIFLFLITFVSAQSLGTADAPPRLRDLEPLLVQIIYIVWAMGGLIFTVLLMIIGFRYMTSMGDPQKQEEIKKKGKNWIIGLIIFFIGYPIVLTIYNVIGIGETNEQCYSKIVTPGFHFFFPDVCTDPQASSSKFALGAECKNFTDEEKGVMMDGHKCCSLDQNSIFPTDKWIQTYESADSIESVLVLYSYDFSENGDCTRKSSCAIGAEGCQPDYKYYKDTKKFEVQQ